MQQALVLSKRSTCLRAQVGCVLVKDTHPISMGYNGSVKGSLHCNQLEGGCHLINGKCGTCLHAEEQAVIFGSGVVGAQAYVTHSPCWHCLKILVQAGISEIIYLKDYRLTETLELAAKHQIKLPLLRQVSLDGNEAS
jgi:dCMP deaminase